jgi:hypothetical protein
MKKKYFNTGTGLLTAGFIALATSYYMGSVTADTITATDTQYMIFTAGFIVGFVLIVASALFFVLAVTKGK